MRMLKIAGFFSVFVGLALAGYFASAAELMKIVYTLNPQTASTASDHTLSFRTPSAISSGTITLYLRNVVSSMGATTITTDDVDLSHGTSLANQTQYTLGDTPNASGRWGVTINTSTRTVQFTYPTGGATQISAQDFIVIKIGKNADGGTLNAGASNRQMVNSATIATRTFTIVAQPSGGTAHVGTGYARGGSINGVLEVAAPPAAQSTTSGTPSVGGGSTTGSTSSTGTTSSSTTSSTAGTGSTTGTTSTPSTEQTTTTSPAITTTTTSTTTTAQTPSSQTQTPPAPPPPLPPDLSATANGKVSDLSVAFSCAASGGTSPYSYTWAFGDGATSAGASATHAYKTGGSYSAECNAKDSTGKTVLAVAAVQVSAALSVSVTESTVELTSSLICSASGGKAEYFYAWAFGDGATGAGASIDHTYKVAGLYTATCTVADALGKSAKASRTIAAVEPLSLSAGIRLSPDASLVQSVQGFVHANKGLDVYGICSARGGVSPYSYTWSFGDGSSSTLSNASHTYRDIGVRSVRCTVFDARGKSIVSDPLSVTVLQGLRVKTTAHSATDSSGIVAGAGASLACAASGGTPAYGYRWSIIDGSGKTIRRDDIFSSGAIQTYTFTSPGTFTVACTVRDRDDSEQSDSVSVGVAAVEIEKALNISTDEVTKVTDKALNEGVAKAIMAIEEAIPKAALVEKIQQQAAQAAPPPPAAPAFPATSSAPASVFAPSPQPIFIPSPPPPVQLTLLAGNSSTGASPGEILPPPPPPGSSETIPDVTRQTVTMTISTSAPVTGAPCEQVGIKNADNATEMFVWFCPATKPISAVTRIKLAAQNAWYGLKKLALNTDQSASSQSKPKKSSVKPQAISLDIQRSLISELSSTIEQQLLRESKKLVAGKIKHANQQQLGRLSGAIKLVVQSGIQAIEAYSFDGKRVADILQISDFSSVVIVKKSLAGRVIEVIVPERFSKEKATDIVLKNDAFFAANVRERSNGQLNEIQKEFNKLAQNAYEEGLAALRKRYAKEIALSSDVDDAIQKTVLQRLQDEKVQKQLINLARSTVVQQVITSATARAAQDEEPLVPGQQPTLSQLLHTPNSVTIAPLSQGQAEKLLKQDLVVPDFPGARPIPNQIKEVNILNADGMGLVRLPSPMKLTMCWDDAILNAMNVSIDPANPSKSMCIAHFNPSTGTGKCEQSTFDMASKCATTEVASASIFALFGRAGAQVISAEEGRPRVHVNVMPSVRLRLVESLIDSEDLGIYQAEEAATPSELGGSIYIAPSTQLSLCVSPNVFLKKVKDITITIGSKTQSLRYEQSRECFSGSITAPNEKGAQHVKMRVIYIDDQVQTITLKTVVTNRLQAIVLNQIALPVNEVSKIVAALNEQVKETVEVAQPALQTTALATAPVVAVANPAVLTNTVNWYHYLNHLFSWLFSILGFRKRRKPWGVVYDAAAKQPIDLAVVRLFDAKTKKLIETQVTDKQGRFSFLTAAGTYSISVAKPPYVFPSAIIKERIDGAYANIYRQEDLTIASQDQVMNMSIPLDPPSREQVKGLTVQKQVYQFFKQHSSGSLWIGLMISGALAYYTPGPINSALLGLNAVYVFFQFVIMGKTEKPWGIVFSTATLEPIPLAAISIIDAKENKVLRTRLTDYYGRFNFLTPPGEYSVIVAKDAYSFPVPPSVPVQKYRHVYRGGSGRIKKDKGYIKINVPLAPKNDSKPPTS